MACPEFEVAGGGRLPEVEPSGLLEGVPARVLEKAREWERHVVEARTGLLPDAPAGAVPRLGFDPAATTVGERDRAKAAELGVSPRTVQERRLRYGARACGAWSISGPPGAARRPAAPTPGWWLWSATWSTPRRTSPPAPGRG